MSISGYILTTAGGKSINFFDFFHFPMWVEPIKTISGFFYDVHVFVSYCLIALIVVHVGAALKHHFIERDNILKRML